MKKTKAVKRKKTAKKNPTTIEVSQKQYVVGCILTKPETGGRTTITLRMRHVLAISGDVAVGAELPHALADNPGAAVSMMKYLPIVTGEKKRK